ncbi:MAG: hypothetical protein ACOX7C_06705 [Brevefilum sp.]|jgi:hypothetical protein
MMNRKSSVANGVILVLLGAFLLARELFPEYFQFLEWPFIIIGLGAIFLIWAILSGAGGLAVPGSILAGLGGILYYQNLTGDWQSWAYVWSLIPVFVGLGVIISGIINRRLKQDLSSGLTLIVIGAILFFIFGTSFGLDAQLSRYWPVLLIVLGLASIFRALVKRKN